MDSKPDNRHLIVYTYRRCTTNECVKRNKIQKQHFEAHILLIKNLCIIYTHSEEEQEVHTYLMFCNIGSVWRRITPLHAEGVVRGD